MWRVIAFTYRTRAGAAKPSDFARIIVDTTVQPKAVAHPTDARLIHKAIEKLAGFARRHGIELRQSYLRVAKRAAIMRPLQPHAPTHPMPWPNQWTLRHLW